MSGEKILYTAEAHVEGGRIDGHGKTGDGTLEVDFRIPEQLGGPGGGTNPEQLFALGYAACFDNAVASVARRLKLEPEGVSVDAKVQLHPTAERGFGLSVALDVHVAGVSDEDARRLVEAAHKVCPYSNATRGNVDVALSVDGAAL